MRQTQAVSSLAPVPPVALILSETKFINVIDRKTLNRYRYESCRLTWRLTYLCCGLLALIRIRVRVAVDSRLLRTIEACPFENCDRVCISESCDAAFPAPEASYFWLKKCINVANDT